jgi:hypothetical protein
LLPDLEAGATGSMTGGGFPDGIKPILEAHRAGRRAEAIAAYERWLPLINIENRQCGFLAAKALMKEGGVIACEAPRHPWPPLNPFSRSLLVETARRLDAMVLRWGHELGQDLGRFVGRVRFYESASDLDGIHGKEFLGGQGPRTIASRPLPFMTVS